MVTMNPGDTVTAKINVRVFMPGSELTVPAGTPMTLLYRVSNTWRVSYQGLVGFVPERLVSRLQ